MAKYETNERGNGEGLASWRRRCASAIFSYANANGLNRCAHEYCGEAEHSEGAEYWGEFNTLEECLADFLIYAEEGEVPLEEWNAQFKGKNGTFREWHE